MTIGPETEIRSKRAHEGWLLHHMQAQERPGSLQRPAYIADTRHGGALACFLHYSRAHQPTAGRGEQPVAIHYRATNSQESS